METLRIEKLLATVVPSPGIVVKTATLAVPGLAINVAGTEAVIWKTLHAVFAPP
ncbi:MAG TPA: hypothetical protein VKT32_11805 [Chthonomonadaceae bacterium]|nr:hypothetical protein [Chthonomonadaceae bacterium]